MTRDEANKLCAITGRRFKNHFAKMDENAKRAYLNAVLECVEKFPFDVAEVAVLEATRVLWKYPPAPEDFAQAIANWLDRQYLRWKCIYRTLGIDDGKLLGAELFRRMEANGQNAGWFYER